jgi:hypothetical protein
LLEHTIFASFFTHPNASLSAPTEMESIAGAVSKEAKTLAQFFRKKNKEPEAVVFFCDWVVAVVMYIGALH